MSVKTIFTDILYTAKIRQKNYVKLYKNIASLKIKKHIKMLKTQIYISIYCFQRQVFYS